MIDPKQLAPSDRRAWAIGQVELIGASVKVLRRSFTKGMMPSQDEVDESLRLVSQLAAVIEASDPDLFNEQRKRERAEAQA